MREAFNEKNFRVDTLAVIEQANKIIAEYSAQGFSLTLRQLYYQFVSRDLIRNVHSEYKRLGSIINDARLAGRIDWAAIEDRTRNLETPSVWRSPDSIIASVARHYQEDLWRSQTYAPEVWIEKDALIGVIERICEEKRVPYFACRGNVSQSEQYTAGKRMAAAARNGRKPIVFHLGDHDPSGIDMTRDNQERLSMFAGQPIEVVRLALNADQIEQYSPPPNPAKETDSRFAAYAAIHGDESWELDALEPSVIEQLIRDALDGITDAEEWALAEEEEVEHREGLERASERWGDVQDFLGNE